MKFWLLLVSAVALWSPGLSYFNYQAKLPNGQHVPHPCKPNYIWHGVGHQNPLGGGERNQFGLDFASHGHKWTAELCHMDSDKDGLTNGQELGDPYCVWTEGSIPTSTDNITHPDVHNITLRFPRTKVPTAETTYTCFAFDIPSTETYHLIANTPYIDNPNVVHHIVVYACDDTAQLSSEPVDCLMGYPGCTKQIAVWTVGMTGECMHPDAGFRIGKGASTKLAFQFHWTNKHMVDHWYDSSGVTLYYTPKLRPYDAASFSIGQLYLEIPPGQPSVTASGSCTSACTQQYLSGSIKVTAALSHMHYLGTRGQIEQIRNGHVINNLTNDQPYSYDSPHVWEYPDPLEVLPGDELKMICEYASLSKNRTTQYGAGSYNEMCFGIITYYPAQNLDLRGAAACMEYKGVDICSMNQSGCDFANPVSSAAYQKVMDNCNQIGSCRSECPAAIAEARKISPCPRLQESLWDYTKYIFFTYINNTDLFRLISAIDTCDKHPAGQLAGMTSPTTPPPVSTSGGCHGGSMMPSSGGKREASAQDHKNEMSAAQTFLQLAKELGSRPLLQNIIMNVNEG